MDSLTSLGSSAVSTGTYSLPTDPHNSQAAALSTLLAADNVSVEFNDLYKALSVGAQEIVNKINELLKTKLPNGVQSLKPEEVTAEATADRIVTGVTASFEAYRKGRADEDPETVLNDYLKAVKQGVSEGYDDAYETLDALGAFEFEGVEAGIVKTKELIGEKLAQFEAAKRKELGLDTDETVTAKTADAVSSGLLGSGGYTVSKLNIAA